VLAALAVVTGTSLAAAQPRLTLAAQPSTVSGVDQASGTFHATIPIDVPSFHGITPQLALGYDSSESNSWTGVGWTGVGWSLKGFSRIEAASPGRGAPAYAATDIFLLDGQELVPCAAGSASPSCTSGGTHSTKNESYARIVLTGTGTNSRWTVTAKDGTTSVYVPVYVVSYGADGIPNTPDDTEFRWGIYQVSDTKGNTVTYNWTANQFGCCYDYPTTISYNGTTITLYYEARSDNETSAVGPNGLTTVWGRIKTIDVTVGGSRLRSYKLTYASSAATTRSLLTTVQEFGKDATLDSTGTVTGGTSLPAIAAGYQSASTSFVAGASDNVGWSQVGGTFMPMDINGDGKTDMVELYVMGFLGNKYGRRTWISTGSGFTLGADVSNFATTNVQIVPMDINGDGKSDLVVMAPNQTLGIGTWTRTIYLSTGTDFVAGASDSSITYKGSDLFYAGDFNGDGKSDLLVLVPSSSAWTRSIYLSTGSGFAAPITDTQANGPYATTYFVVADINGDGKSDLVSMQTSSATSGQWGRYIYLSTGSGFVAGGTNSTVPSPGGGDVFLPMDVNGDGKMDIVHLYQKSFTYGRDIWFSDGSTFVQGTTDTISANYEAASSFFAMDVNGDGKTDLLEIQATTSVGAGVRNIWLSTGAQFVLGAHDTALGYSSGLSTSVPEMFLPADINGDGMTDMVDLKLPAGTGGAVTRKIWMIGGAVPDLMTSLSNGWGGTTTVGYTPSTAWTNINNPPIRQTATSLKVSDGRGGIATTTYAYSGLTYDNLEGRLMGFAYAKATLPCIAGESACPYTESWFRQDYNTVMQPSRVDHRSGAGQILTSAVYEYTTNGATLPWTGLQTGEWDYTYINAGAACPGTDCKRTYTNLTFNAYGEVAQSIGYGDYDASGDEVTTTTTFVPNTSAYIVNKPADVKSFQGAGTTGALLSETLTYYDGASTASQAPSVGLPTTSSFWLSSPSSFVQTTQTYDAWGNISSRVNALGATTTYAYDATYHLFPTSVTNPLGQQNSSGWDAVCGKPSSTTDVNGQTTTQSYDPLCRMTLRQEPGGKTEQHTWSNLGNPTSQVEIINWPSADGSTNPKWTNIYFDGLLRTYRRIDKGPDGASSSTSSSGDIYVDTAFNARGKIASTTAPYYQVSGGAAATTYATTYSYDALGRLTQVTFPDAATRTSSFGLWSTTTTDELGHVTTDRFNAYGNRTGHDETVGGVIKTTSYTYDARQHLVQSTDPVGNVISYSVDSLGRTIAMSDPDWGASTYVYDGQHRLISQTDAKGQQTAFGYDALDRKTTKTSNAGTSSAVTVSWAYDQARTGFYNVGSMTTLSDAAGTQTIDHDVRGRTVKSVRTIGGTGYTFSYGYDTGDRLLWTTYPDGDTQGTAASPLSYDSSGRLKSIPGYVTSALYNAAGQLRQVNNANSTVTTLPFSPQRGWITGIATTVGSTTIQNLAYSRNAKGLLSGVTSPIANEGWTYTKDELDRMTAATNTSSATYNQAVAYDAIGNIASSSRVGTYSYGTTHPHAVTAAGSNTYTYDAAGMMTSGAGRTLTWNGDNQLAQVANGGSTTVFTYDANGERIQAVEGSTTHRYLGDDFETTLPATTTKYISIAGTPVARRDGTTTTYWLHSDQLGSIQAETDASGSVVERKVYRPFGELLSTAGSLAYEPRGFTAQRTDDSGLVYFHHRYYDPTLARFVSPDPVIDGRNTIGLNRYAYAGNDPADYTDVSGLDQNLGKFSPQTYAPNGNASKGQPSTVAGGSGWTQPTSTFNSTTYTVHNGTVTTSNNAGTVSANWTTSQDAAHGGTVLTVGNGVVTYSSYYFAPPPPPPPPSSSSSSYAGGSGSAGGASSSSSDTGTSVVVPLAEPNVCIGDCWDYRSLTYNPNYVAPLTYVYPMTPSENYAREFLDVYLGAKLSIVPDGDIGIAMNMIGIYETLHQLETPVQVPIAFGVVRTNIGQ
jgi:RHS repeat-associated protein